MVYLGIKLSWKNEPNVCKYDEPHGSYRCLEGSSSSKATFLGRKSLKKSCTEICFGILTCSPQTSPAIILADSRCGSSTGTVVRCLSRDLHDSDTHRFFCLVIDFPQLLGITIFCGVGVGIQSFLVVCCAAGFCGTFTPSTSKQTAFPTTPRWRPANGSRCSWISMALKRTMKGGCFGLY